MVPPIINKACRDTDDLDNLRHLVTPHGSITEVTSVICLLQLNMLADSNHTSEAFPNILVIRMPAPRAR